MYILKNYAGFILCVGIAVYPNLTVANSKFSSGTWLDSQILNNPEVIEAQELLNASTHKVNSASQAIYNPNFESSYEREGNFNNYSFGLSQTIDMGDKRSINQRIAQMHYFSNQQRLKNIIETKKSQALSALINWNAAKQSSYIALEQEKQLETLLSIVDEKKRAGILGQLDVELIYLSLSQTLSNIADYQLKLKNAEVQVQELLPDWTPKKVTLPKEGIGISNYQVNPAWIDSHPLVEVAKTQWRIKQKQAQLTSAESKIDPTIGINAGKNAKENTIGITFSMPLNIRNNYSEDIKAAYTETNAAEASYQSINRKQTFKVKANFESVITNKKYFERWQSLMAGRGRNSAKLLKNSWDAGDISTSDYLLALNQRAEGLYSGIQLETLFKLSEIDFLLSIGQLSKLKI